MSGIAGIFHIEIAKPVDPVRMQAMTAAQGRVGTTPVIWTGRGVGLGGDAAPAMTSDRRLAVICDGMICNVNELRAQLERHGHLFETQDDREVILHGWRQWGETCVQHMDGPFAFALLDARRQCLYLVRDRLGERPLHYARLGDGSLIFSSKISGLLANPLLRRELSANAVDDYLALGHVPDDVCLIGGVSKLAPGHCLTVVRGESVPAPRRWWSVGPRRQGFRTTKALQDELLARLGASVKARMTAPGPVGAMWTNDIDSAAVLALMAEQSAGAVKTVGIGSDGVGGVDSIISRFAADHRSRKTSDRDHSLLDAVAAATDEPFADPAALQHWRLYALAAEKLAVALGGVGGEALVGASITTWIGGWLPVSSRPPLMSGEGAYIRRAMVVSTEQRTRLYSQHGARALQGHRPEQRFIGLFRSTPANGALQADLSLILPGRVLAASDRIARATGIEVRHPMLDHHLVEFVAGLAPWRQWRGGGRQLLRQAMTRYLPADTLDRLSMERPVPVSAWFRDPLAEDARRLAKGSALTDTGLFDGGAISRIVTDHQSGTADNGRLLWQLLMLERSLARLFGFGRQSG